MALHIPTSLSKEQVAEFKALYKKRFGDVLSNQEAYETGLRLVQFIGIIAKDNPVFMRNLDDQKRS